MYDKFKNYLDIIFQLIIVNKYQTNLLILYINTLNTMLMKKLRF